MPIFNADVSEIHADMDGICARIAHNGGSACFTFLADVWALMRSGLVPLNFNQEGSDCRGLSIYPSRFPHPPTRFAGRLRAG